VAAQSSLALGENTKAKTEMTIGDYKITFFRERGRINIES